MMTHHPAVGDGISSDHLGVGVGVKLVSNDHIRGQQQLQAQQ